MVTPTWTVIVGGQTFRVPQTDLGGFCQVLIFNHLAFEVYRDDVESMRFGGELPKETVIE